MYIARYMPEPDTSHSRKSTCVSRHFGSKVDERAVSCSTTTDRVTKYGHSRPREERVGIGSSVRRAQTGALTRREHRPAGFGRVQGLGAQPGTGRLSPQVSPSGCDSWLFHAERVFLSPTVYNPLRHDEVRSGRLKIRFLARGVCGYNSHPGRHPSIMSAI